MPSFKDDPPDQEYLDSIKKHTDKETNQVNLALVAKDFGYASGKSFQKKYAKLKKAHNLTNGHIYGDYRPGNSSTKAATTEAATTDAATTEVTRTPPKDTLTPEVKQYLRSFLEPWAKIMMETEKERDAKERGTTKKG
ncbi:hypothetical protein N7449_001170 [Penicillium cf. viridicatum]|uniref:Uncharacterized protein n=1 Tax=Penicillium cf. viridicatum TaxID=2972119 RepID=A0A9W9N6B1_9EURO|nr:hypothetical protein N7449_001170 [Penicillium cf. viridicatum]